MAWPLGDQIPLKLHYDRDDWWWSQSRPLSFHPPLISSLSSSLIHEQLLDPLDRYLSVSISALRVFVINTGERSGRRVAGSVVPGTPPRRLTKMIAEF